MIKRSDNTQMNDYNIYKMQKEAVEIDAFNLLLISDPSDELLGIAFRSHLTKVLSGVPTKPLNGEMLLLKIKYETNILKQRTRNKRLYSEL